MRTAVFAIALLALAAGASAPQKVSPGGTPSQAGASAPQPTADTKPADAAAANHSATARQALKALKGDKPNDKKPATGAERH